MKTLSFLLLTLILTSCGKNNSGKDPLNVFREELSVRPTEYANDVYQVDGILRDAVQRGFLQEFHNTKWFNHHGQFLVRSLVLDDQTFKLEVK